MSLISGVANKPALPAGWTPVNCSSGQTFVDTTLEAWDIDYSQVAKKWANAKDTKGNLWVWIPRFTYKTIAYADDPSIDIRFSNDLVDDLTAIGGKALKKHPAFKFDNQELTGIWFPKYAAYQDTVNGNIAGFKPGKEAWRSISVSDIFIQCINLKNHITTNPSGVDSHMVKNSEWGAPAILAKAIGNQRPKINGDNTYKTGYTTAGTPNAAGSLDSTGETSTTGNMTGIFDMVGNTYEYVASYVNNGNANLNTYSKSLVDAAAKYKDVFPMGSGDTQAANYSAAAGITDGMMLHETSRAGTGLTSWKNWNNVGARSDFPYSTNPVFMSGGGYGDSDSGLGCFVDGSGNANSKGGFRACFVVLNSAPLISGNDENLGERNTNFNIKYTVSDADEGDTISIEEKLNGAITKTIASANQNFEYDININISELAVGNHEIKIEATDSKGSKSIRTYTFSIVAKRYTMTLDKDINIAADEKLVGKDLITKINGKEMKLIDANQKSLVYECEITNNKVKLDLEAKSTKTVDKLVYTVY